MIVVPARLKSSRFEHKVLVDVLGLPMVIRTAKQVESIDRVVIATDSQKVMDIAKKYSIEAVLTSESHNSGTDRINEACEILKLDGDEVIVNVQADEPFIELDVVQAVIDRVKSSNSFMVSAYKEISSELADDFNLVKVVLDDMQNAIYFSRAKIPHNRDHNEMSYFGHLGIYGFRVKNLKEFCNLDYAPIEHIEKLEQLRAIYHTKSISMVKVDSRSFGIDTEHDLNRAIKIFGD
jgi:3-deoxy-manno-octulosonate cytidylyltransferase (CMP-KDO synthetase)